MSFIKNSILTLIFLLIFSVSFSQTATNDSLRGEFTYLLQCKPNTESRDYIYKELFSLKVSDHRSFFISENRLKFDSLARSQINKSRNNFNIDLRNMPSSKFNFLIIQNMEGTVQFYQSLAMTLLSYHSPVIDDWKLINETKIINSIVCHKAEVFFKGRDWTAWYSPEIPLPYGPYKFSGLPGLIVKITDRTGDYDFELVKSVPSSDLTGKVITVSKRYYQNPKIVTEREFVKAKRNYRENIRHQLERMGTVFSEDQRPKTTGKENGYNPIELSEE